MFGALARRASSLAAIGSAVARAELQNTPFRVLWHIAARGGHSLNRVTVGTTTLSVFEGPEPPVMFAEVLLEDGAVPSRQSATDNFFRWLQGANKGSVAILVPTIGDFLKIKQSRTETYSGEDIFLSDGLLGKIQAPYELLHALVDLIHCTGVAIECRADSIVDRDLWEASKKIASVEFWPGGAILSLKGGLDLARVVTTAWPETFESTARAQPTVSDKVTVHSYGFLYDIHLSRIRAARAIQGEPVRLLEIGLGCDMYYGAGASIPIWKAYFAGNVELTVLEFDAACASSWASRNPETSVFTGDQRNRDLLREIIVARGPFDVIIDDGGHSMEMQTTAIEVFFPLALHSGGVLFVEDLLTSHSPPGSRWRDGPPTIGVLADIFDAVVSLGRQFDASARSAIGQRNGLRPLINDIRDGLDHVQCSAEICALVRN